VDSTTSSAASIDREVRCKRCGAQPKLIEKMLDPRRGHTLRVFRCTCGEQTWTSNPE